MVALKVFFGTECRRCNSAPASFSELLQYVYSVTSLFNPVIQYEDEEGDLITISTEGEYQDFLSCFPTLAKLKIQPSKVEQSSETAPVFKTSSASLAGPLTSEQSIETRVRTEDKSQGMVKARTNESGCDPHEASNKIIETVPLYTSSVLSGSEINTSEKFTNTKSNLIESIRNIVREEFGRSSQLKLSGILLKHFGVQCSGCKANPIIGIRYKCSVCDFNFCEQCEYCKDHEHPFFKIRLPEKVVKEEEKKDLVKQEKNSSSQPEKKYEENLKKLVEIGFDSGIALEALIACQNKLEEALNNLIIKGL